VFTNDAREPISHTGFSDTGTSALAKLLIKLVVMVSRPIGGVLSPMPFGQGFVCSQASGSLRAATQACSLA